MCFLGFCLSEFAFFPFSGQQVLPKGRVCQSAQAPLQHGLKIRSSHLPSFDESAHMLFSMSANAHARGSDDTSSPPDTSSSWRKTSRCFLLETPRGSQSTDPASLRRHFPEVTSWLLLLHLQVAKTEKKKTGSSFYVVLVLRFDKRRQFLCHVDVTDRRRQSPV